MTDYSYKALDEVIHGRVRLAVMAFLMTAESCDFTELRAALEVTDGNLSIQLRKLEEAGYVQVDKSFRGRRPLTTVAITPAGCAAMEAYHAHLQRLLRRLP